MCSILDMDEIEKLVDKLFPFILLVVCSAMFGADLLFVMSVSLADNISAGLLLSQVIFYIQIIIICLILIIYGIVQRCRTYSDNNLDV